MGGPPIAAQHTAQCTQQANLTRKSKGHMQEKSTAKENQVAEECKEALQTTAKQQEHTTIQEQKEQKHTVYKIYN